MEDSFRHLSNELAKVEDGTVKAFADKGKVIFMIQNAPEELRRLADALEKINIREIQAMVAYELPTSGKDVSPTPAPKRKKKRGS